MAPMDRRIFETYVETHLAPTLRPGDIVASATKSGAAEAKGWRVVAHSSSLNLRRVAFRRGARFAARQLAQKCFGSLAEGRRPRTF